MQTPIFRVSYSNPTQFYFDKGLNNLMMVEVMGIEPMSESTFTGASPSADCDL